jgi:hypothetical protein
MNRCQCLGSRRLPSPHAIRSRNARAALRRSARLRVLMLVALPSLIFVARAAPASPVGLDALIDGNLTITQGNLLFSNFTFSRFFPNLLDPDATGTPTTPAGITVEGITLPANPFHLPQHGLSFTGPITVSTGFGFAGMRITIGYDVAILDGVGLIDTAIVGAGSLTKSDCFCGAFAFVSVETLDGHSLGPGAGASPSSIGFAHLSSPVSSAHVEAIVDVLVNTTPPGFPPGGGGAGSAALSSFQEVFSVPVPEPASLVLVSGGVAALAAVRFRARRK